MAEPKKKHMTESEIAAFLKASKTTRHGDRDYCMALMAFRHGFRVSELVDVRLNEVDLDAGRIYVRRKKKSKSTNQPIAGDELRVIRRWLKERSAESCAHLPWLFLSERKSKMTRQAVNYLFAEIAKKAALGFKVNPHMLRHSCGFALADQNMSTQIIQDYLGHSSIQNTVIYTATNAKRFEAITWD